MRERCDKPPEHARREESAPEGATERRVLIMLALHERVGAREGGGCKEERARQSKRTDRTGEKAEESVFSVEGGGRIDRPLGLYTPRLDAPRQKLPLKTGGGERGGGARAERGRSEGGVGRAARAVLTVGLVVEGVSTAWSVREARAPCYPHGMRPRHALGLAASLAACSPTPAALCAASNGWADTLTTSALVLRSLVETEARLRWREHCDPLPAELRADCRVTQARAVLAERRAAYETIESHAAAHRQAATALDASGVCRDR